MVSGIPVFTCNPVGIHRCWVDVNETVVQSAMPSCSSAALAAANNERSSLGVVVRTAEGAS
jgi:hypothetical protein